MTCTDILGHTYKWTKSDGTFVYVKTTLLRDTGFKVGSRGDPLLVFGRCLMRFWFFPLRRSTERTQVRWLAAIRITALKSFLMPLKRVTILHGMYTL